MLRASFSGSTMCLREAATRGDGRAAVEVRLHVASRVPTRESQDSITHKGAIIAVFLTEVLEGELVHHGYRDLGGLRCYV